MLDSQAFGIINTLEKMLGDSFYISGWFDPFYVPAKSEHNKEHRDQEFFLFGFNRTLQLFYAAGYIKTGRYSPYEISYADFVNALRGVNRPRIHITFRHVKNPERLVFNPSETINDIRQYLASEKLTVSKSNREWGLNAWRKIRAGIDHGKLLDLQKFRWFMEHKSVMLSRLKLLDVSMEAVGPLISQYQTDVYEKALLVYYHALKQKVSPSKNNIKKIQSLMEESNESESRILSVIT